MMDLMSLAAANRLRVRRDEGGSRIISGKNGHLWDHGAGLFAVTLLDLTRRKWTHRKKLCLKAGMELHQDGDFEGTLLFDPEDSEQVKVALSVAGVKKRRQLSPEHRERLMEVGAMYRFSSRTGQERLSSDFNAREEDGGASEGGRDLSAVSFFGGEGLEAA